MGTNRIPHRRIKQFVSPVLQFIGLVPRPVCGSHCLSDPLPVRRSALRDWHLPQQLRVILLLLAANTHRTKQPECDLRSQESKKVCARHVRLSAEYPYKILAEGMLGPCSSHEYGAPEYFVFAKRAMCRDENSLVLLPDISGRLIWIDPAPFRAQPEGLPLPNEPYSMFRVGINSLEPRPGLQSPSAADITKRAAGNAPKALSEASCPRREVQSPDTKYLRARDRKAYIARLVMPPEI